MQRYRSTDVSRFVAVVAAAATAVLAARVSAKVLVVAPHPDDDIVMAGGVIARATARGEPVRVVFLTNGDATGRDVGSTRQGEAVAALAELGVEERDLIFLGYPDGQLENLLANFPRRTDVFSFHDQDRTYGDRGIGSADYHTHRFGAPAPYNGFHLVDDIRDILASFRPDHVFVTSEADEHADHRAAYAAAKAAIRQVRKGDRAFDPIVHKTVVWSLAPERWPGPASPTSYLTPAPLRAGVGMPWDRRESLDVPLALQSPDPQANPKYLAIARHVSQGGNGAFIGGFLHKDEIFWPERAGRNRPPIAEAGADRTAPRGATVALDGQGSFDLDGQPLVYRWRQTEGPPVHLSRASTPSPTFVVPVELVRQATACFELVVSDGAVESFPDAVAVRLGTELPPPENVARFAAARASSEDATAGQLASAAIDGVAEGYSAGDPAREWATAGQGAGAWIELAWRKPQIVDRVALSDRPNADDRITSGTLTFSDGPPIAVGALPNLGRKRSVSFAARSIRWVRWTVTGVGPTTRNVGLAEFEVFSTPAPVGTPPAPTVDEAFVAAMTDPVRPGGGTANPASLVVARDEPAGETNVAGTAAVTASSENLSTGQAATRAVDGHGDGFPGDPTHEWATPGQGPGAWIELAWTTPRLVSRVVLRDRPNLQDQVLSGTLTFGDGSSLPVGPLANAGVPVAVAFAPRRIDRVRFTVGATSPTTANVGLAEIEIWAASGATAEARP